MTISEGTARIVVINAGVTDPSSTRMLADRLAGKSVEHLGELGITATAGTIELAPLAADLARAITTGYPSDALQQRMAELATADAVIAATPVYKAGPSGLFKMFLDVLDDDALIAKPVLLAATAGSNRHALVIDQQLRPLFAYLRALTLPTSVFATSDDWSASDLARRVDRAAGELADLVASGVSTAITGRSWSAYRHDDSRATTTSSIQNNDIDFDSPLMRLAVGR
ncbi:MAG TPA: CE1759 family FMN reductase [Pseudolysinimonas sp.]|nr:CE1759 family FMN reductase [Pseudolysinimonas sp.]